jgi:hypothetical protein
VQDLFRHLRIHTSTKEKKRKMIWIWLRLSKFFNKIGNYFYYKHVQCVKKIKGDSRGYRTTKIRNRGR